MKDQISFWGPLDPMVDRGLNKWHKWGIWEVANGKMLVLLFRCWQIKKSNTSVKLTRSNPFRIQFIEKNNWGGANENRCERNDW